MLEIQDLGMQVLELQLHFIALIGILAHCWLNGCSHCPIPFSQEMRKASIAQAECWNPYMLDRHMAMCQSQCLCQ